MSNILVDTSGKGGPCCSKSIDLERGCRNKCVSCYGSKTSLMGTEKYFNDIVLKDFDEKKFKSSVKKAIREGYQYSRIGKHSDPGAIETREKLKQVLDVCNEEGLRLVLVSKSLTPNKEIAKLLKDGGHTLHMSLGMITKAQSNGCRKNAYEYYEKYGVNTKLRVVEDITKPIDISYTANRKNSIIVTPLRLNSKEVAKEYDIELTKYKYVNGYYKPILEYVHQDWQYYSNWCGEVYTETGVDVFSFCAKCGVLDEI